MTLRRSANWAKTEKVAAGMGFAVFAAWLEKPGGPPVLPPDALGRAAGKETFS